jgi:sigma-E factor negative regulatory protein RseC
MIEENATVTAVENGSAWVETERSGTCGGCAANKGCGTSVLAKVLGQRRTRVHVLNSVGAAVGDRVVIGIAEEALVRGSAAVYLVPLLGLFAGAVSGANLWEWWTGTTADWPAILAGATGLAAGLIWVRQYGARIRYNPAFQPVILRRENSASLDIFPGVIVKHH